uniref:DUF6598 domain-containing protein n=1 Tax=Oryza meridionalis TaxID=40149 RepID=A0A0E0EHQ0_9ORYZ
MRGEGGVRGRPAPLLAAVEVPSSGQNPELPRRRAAAAIPPMRFTHKPALDCSAGATPTLQVFSVEVEATSGGLQWPLDVFGIVAMRDDLDRNRNIVFHRTRDNCQTLTQEKVAVTADGKIKLSRCVVSVESNAELKVSVKAWKGDNNVVEKAKVFTALKAGVRNTTLDIGFCNMEISVAWSLISQYPVSANSIPSIGDENIET